MTETVWIASERVSVYHTDEDCTHAINPIETDLDDLSSGVRECKYCSGEFEENAEKCGKEPQDLIRDLEVKDNGV